jgi:hypothetical protein
MRRVRGAADATDFRPLLRPLFKKEKKHKKTFYGPFNLFDGV